MEKHSFSKCRARAFWLIAFLSFAIQSFAQQQIAVKGKVIDERNEPIIGANIMEKGTTNGVISDFDGLFSLNVSPNATLII